MERRDASEDASNCLTPIPARREEEEARQDPDGGRSGRPRIPWRETCSVMVDTGPSGWLPKPGEVDPFAVMSAGSEVRRWRQNGTRIKKTEGR